MNREIITIATGPPSYFAMLRPSMEAYAARTGATYRILTGSSSDLHPKIPLFRHVLSWSESAADTDRLLYLDADVWIRANAPDIFALEGRGVWGKTAYHPRCGRSWKRWARRHYALSVNPSTYLNAGVLMIDGAAARAISPHIRPPWVLGWMDQHQINAAFQLAGVTVNPLGQEWNAIPWAAASRPAVAHFIHFAGQRRQRDRIIARTMARFGEVRS